MGYIEDKNKMIYKSVDALVPVQRVINEAGKALSDKTMTIDDSEISEVLRAAGSMAVGGCISFAALFYGGVTGLSAAGITSGLAAAGGIVGGGMAAGVLVLAAPVAVLGAGAAIYASSKNKKKLKQAKELCYKEAIKKQNAIIRELSEERTAAKERIELLTGYNNLLRGIINDLGHDLGY